MGQIVEPKETRCSLVRPLSLWRVKAWHTWVISVALQASSVWNPRKAVSGFQDIPPHTHPTRVEAPGKESPGA